MKTPRPPHSRTRSTALAVIIGASLVAIVALAVKNPRDDADVGVVSFDIAPAGMPSRPGPAAEPRVLTAVARHAAVGAPRTDDATAPKPTDAPR